VLAIAAEAKRQNRVVCIYDPNKSECLQLVALPEMDLVYDVEATTSGHSTTTLAPPPPSYQNTVVGSYDGSLTLLGLSAMLEVRSLAWKERIESFTQIGKWIHALALSLDFYEGTAPAPVGLPPPGISPSTGSNPLRDVINSKLEALLLSYVDLALGRFARQPRAGRGGGSVSLCAQKDVPHFRVVGGVVIDYCLVIQRQVTPMTLLCSSRALFLLHSMTMSADVPTGPPVQPNLPKVLAGGRCVSAAGLAGALHSQQPP
jgi:hypothetical protein